MTRSGRESWSFEAFDLTGTAWPTAQLAGCDAKTVARYVAAVDRRAAAEVKQAWRAERRRRYRPWVPEPGMSGLQGPVSGPARRYGSHLPIGGV